MSGKRTLDAFSLLNASRAIAARHIEFRRNQLALRVRTSSLTKEAKVQTDRLSAGLQAAYELSKRFDGTAAVYTEERKDEGYKKQETILSQLDKDYPKEGPARKETHAERMIPSTSTEDISKTEDLGEKKAEDGAANVSPELIEKPPGDEARQLFRSQKAANIVASEDLSKTSQVSPPTPSDTDVKIDETAAHESPRDIGKSDMLKGPSLSHPTYEMIESRVPSSRVGRLWEYSGLATSVAFGVIGESFRRIATGGNDSGSLILSPGNVERLVAKLSKMRGAALKIGQMMSFQDAKMMPEALREILQRVQDKANYMPASQRDRVLVDNLGPNWRDKFAEFEERPMAAASIGQVHGAMLKDGRRVAVKIQYPGVAKSIDSDLNNIAILLNASRLLPRGLYLDKTIDNARTELTWECDYRREAECAKRFRKLLADDTDTFFVPAVIDHVSGPQVLTMEYVDGVAVTRIQNFTQAQRDWIGTQILRLCFREICEFRFMQTDPNWTNFLYNSTTRKLELLDFGASREYPTAFVSTYCRLLRAAAAADRPACADLSQRIGYLTGFESPEMVDAHISSMLTLAEPFASVSAAPGAGPALEIYDFADQTVTGRVRALIPLMLEKRLTPPPEETYSLHRKLSGAFLLCARLGSRVRCRELFNEALSRVEWVNEEEGGEKM